MRELTISYSAWKQVAQGNEYTVYARNDGGTASKVAWCGNTDVVFETYISGEDLADFNTNFPSPTTVSSRDDALALVIGLSDPEIVSKSAVEEGTKGTGGHFASECLDIDVESCTPGTWSDHDFNFPIPISLFSAQFIASDETAGDEIQFQLSPDTVVGAIAADVAVDDDEITVSAGAYSYLEVGYFMELNDTSKYNNLGRVLEKLENNKVKVENKATDVFSAATPTYVLLTVKMVPHGHLPSTSRLVIGESKIGGTYLGAGTPMRMKYQNNDGAAKTLEFWLEYLY